MKKKLLVIAGPTAVGKTALSLNIAKKLNSEIISADSMQVYKYMDIGTAKIKVEDMQGIKHHLIDILLPDEEFNITIFKDMAKQALNSIYQNSEIPIVAGGTGFYIQSLLYDIDFTSHSDSKAVRESLEKEYDEYGAEYMHDKLRAVDSYSADIIHMNNKKRLIRALEYNQITGLKISEHNIEQSNKISEYDFRYIVLNMDRKLLYNRIDRRVDEMVSLGLVNEVEKLKAKGYNKGLVSMQGLGYKEILDYLEGGITLEEAIYIIKRDTRRFAKRQLTWFRREKDIIWYDINENDDIDSLSNSIINLF